MTETWVALVLATSTGGVGQHVRSLAERLAKAGHRVVVCGPAATERLFSFTGVGARFRAVEIAAGLDPLRDAVAVAGLRTATSGAEVVHAHGFRAGVIAAAATAWRPAQPLVVTWHNAVLAEGGRGRLLHALSRRVARAADITLAASEDLMERALALGARDVRFAPVAAPTASAPVRSAEDIRTELGAQGRPLVLSVGRLHAQKSYEVLVAAAARWADPVVAIAGSGPEEQSLRLRAAELGAPVLFLGHRTDVPDLLAAADLAVVTSRWEARQLFAQEALHAGVPLIATSVGGLPGLLAGGAELIPPGDVDALVRAGERLLADPDARAELAERGRARAATWPTEDDTAEQCAAVYAELLGRPA